MVSADQHPKRQGPRISVWLDGRTASGRARRADQPTGLDRDRITAVAVRLLDAEGAAKFSMRKLAAELDVTAMSLYWYVDTKDDLLELALDKVFGELELPSADGPQDWRDQLRGLAAAYREVLVRHPWASPLMGRFLNIGPHSLAFARSAQDVLARSGLPLHGRTGGLSAVFQFVYGFGTIEGRFAERCADAGVTQDEYFRRSMSTFEDLPQLSDLYDNAVELMEARGGNTVEEMRERDFDFALDLLIAGIEAKAQGEGP